MQYTREQAAKKWCPFARASGDSDGVNRLANGDGDDACTCLADYCMAWQWAEGEAGYEFEYARVYAEDWISISDAPALNDLLADCRQLMERIWANKDAPAVIERLETELKVKGYDVDRWREDFMTKWVPPQPAGEGWYLDNVYVHEKYKAVPSAVFLRPNKDRKGYCGLMKK